MKIYSVVEEFRIDGVVEFNLLDDYSSYDSAVKRVKEEKEKVITDYYDGEDYTIENDKEDLFQAQIDDWDRYEDIRIIEKELITT